MKILIVANELLPHTNANTNIVYRVANTLKEKYDVEICLLGMQTADETELADSPYPTWYMSTTYEYQQKIPTGINKWEKFVWLLLHPRLLWYRVGMAHRYPLQREYRKRLKVVLKKEKDIDCVVCVSCPHDSIYAAVQEIKNTPIIAYQLDPWSTRFDWKGNLQIKKDEDFALSRCTATFITKEMEREMERGIYQPPIQRIVSLAFPNLVYPQAVSKNWFGDDRDDAVHCAYVGNLYTDEVRGPGFLLSLFRALESKNVVLHVIGNTKEQAERYQNELSANIRMHGRVSAKEAKEYMMSADVLVNMGNNVSNMLPSKTIDYIATGKPILNLCKIPDCPTISYIEKYPLAMIAMEEEGISQELIERVAKFCVENKGKELPFEEVKELFYECTPEYVGEVIYRTLVDITGKK